MSLGAPQTSAYPVPPEMLAVSTHPTKGQRGYREGPAFRPVTYVDKPAAPGAVTSSVADSIKARIFEFQRRGIESLQILPGGVNPASTGLVIAGTN